MTKKSIGNLCIFPFTKYKSGEILQIGKSLMKKFLIKIKIHWDI